MQAGSAPSSSPFSENTTDEVWSGEAVHQHQLDYE
jgi:hypothetical protein